MINIEKILKDFPILETKIHGKRLTYLDSGATTQKPISVIKKVNDFYSKINSNIHRGVHYLSNKSTEEYENARINIQKFINAGSSKEIIFTKGTTDGINLVAYSFGEKFVSEGDEILVCETEHHSNIVPWQMLCKRKKAVLKVIPVNDKTEVDIKEFKKLLSSKTKIVAIAHVSNVFGTIHPINMIVEEAHKVGAKVLVDAAQSIQHINIDVQKINCDFLVFSGHKIYAETGIGVLYGKQELLEQMSPYQGGGDMIKSVSFENTTYADLPLKFEAGTSNYVGAVSLSEAINYVNDIGLTEIAEHEANLLSYATEKLQAINELKIIGTSKHKTSAISFNLKNIHHYDAGMVLDKLGIAVRTGMHCAEPSMKRFGITGTVRASFALYNSKEDADILYDGILQVLKMFS